MPRGDDSNVGQKPDGTETQLQLDALNNLKVTLAAAGAPTAVNVEELDGNPIDLNQGNAGAGTQRVAIVDDDTNLVAIKTALELLDDLQGALKSIDTDELITRVTDSSGVEINPAKEDGNLADIKDVLESGVSLPHAEFISPEDFSATYTSSTTLTLAGLSISMSNPQIAYVVQVLADNTSKRWIQGHNCTLKESGGVVTIYPNDASTPFVTADGYEVGLNYQKKAYDATQDALKHLEQSPEKDWYTGFIPLVTAQDLTATNDTLGNSIDVQTAKTVLLTITGDVNDSTDVVLSMFTQETSGGTEFTPVGALTPSVTLWGAVGADFTEGYYLDVTADSYIQLRAIAGTLGVTPGDLTISVKKVF